MFLILFYFILNKIAQKIAIPPSLYTKLEGPSTAILDFYIPGNAFGSLSRAFRIFMVTGLGLCGMPP